MVNETQRLSRPMKQHFNDSNYQVISDNTDNDAEGQRFNGLRLLPTTPQNCFFGSDFHKSSLGVSHQFSINRDTSIKNHSPVSHGKVLEKNFKHEYAFSIEKKISDESMCKESIAELSTFMGRDISKQRQVDGSVLEKDGSSFRKKETSNSTQPPSNDPLGLSQFLYFPVQVSETGAQLHIFDGLVSKNFHDVCLVRSGYYGLRLHNLNETAWDSLYLGIGRMKTIAEFEIIPPALDVTACDVSASVSPTPQFCSSLSHGVLDCNPSFSNQKTSCRDTTASLVGALLESSKHANDSNLFSPGSNGTSNNALGCDGDKMSTPPLSSIPSCYVADTVLHDGPEQCLYSTRIKEGGSTNKGNNGRWPSTSSKTSRCSSTISKASGDVAQPHINDVRLCTDETSVEQSEKYISDATGLDTRITSPSCSALTRVNSVKTQNRLELTIPSPTELAANQRALVCNVYKIENNDEPDNAFFKQYGNIPFLNNSSVYNRNSNNEFYSMRNLWKSDALLPAEQHRIPRVELSNNCDHILCAPHVTDLSCCERVEPPIFINEIITEKGSIAARAQQERTIYFYVSEPKSLLKLQVYASLTLGMRLKCSYDLLYCGTPVTIPLNPLIPFQKSANILSLDGGGVLGISSLKILERLELELQKELKNPTARLADCFDMICGTSTGGIIALGLLAGMHIKDMISMWASLSGKIFEGNRTLFSGVFFEGYDITRLKEVLVRSLGYRFLNTYSRPYCFVTATDVKHNPYELFLFRNYVHHHLATNEHRGSSSFPAWAAAWATSAAPTYLKGPNTDELTKMGFLIRPEVQLCDGALKANNPTMVALEEAARLAGKKLQHFIETDLDLLLSVGTGQPTLRTIEKTGIVSTFQILLNSAHLLTSGTAVHRDVLHWLGDLEDRYFRFNVPGIGDISLDACDKSSYDLIVKATNDYLTDEKYYDTRRLVKKLAYQYTCR